MRYCKSAKSKQISQNSKPSVEIQSDQSIFKFKFISQNSKQSAKIKRNKPKFKAITLNSKQSPLNSKQSQKIQSLQDITQNYAEKKT